MTKNITFGTDGWRAIIAEEFTFDNVALVTKAIAGYIKTRYDSSKPVIIGYDTRFLADKFAERAAETLNKLGLNVKITDSDAPTPVVAYSAKNLNSAGALMFTASHNPAEFCGIKYIPDYAGPATTDITDIIVKNVKRIQNGDETFLQKAETQGITEKFDPKPEYFNAVKKLIDIEKIKNANIKIFYDPLYASGKGYFDTLLKQAGCDVTTIKNWRDPLYGGGMPEPKEKYLGDLKKLVLENPPAVGFSNDGDADRFGVIDEKGNFITPNEVISILFKHLTKNKGAKGSVVKTVATSLMIDKLAALYNVKAHETPVGFKWVGQIMRREDVIIGGEESGGLSILNHIPEKDGIVANLAVLELMAYEKKPLYEIVEELKQEIDVHYINHRLDLRLTEELKNMAMDMFLNNPPVQLGNMKITRINKLDGVKFYFEDNNSWMLVRPSGTEPLLRIYFETDSREKVELMTKHAEDLVKNLQERL
ncbi:MAG TPA: phosphoglucomutase/phosphomannomutase family protein [Candidatus Gastranaerophilales bacterium]|nr:phosphoglucomutase/phosphomannomutase family protein [Candidatus Gastranaerophilales bacterium]